MSWLGENVELVPEAWHLTVKIGNAQHARGQHVVAELWHQKASCFKRPLS